ncbi:MAG: hypothetical protein IJW92_03420, partial [Clostridia bacterium]|nr:hypothetical protein [Clostridia bacterium]
KRHKEAISPSAEGEEGSAPSTARAFEKARPKLFVKLTKAGCFVYSLKCSAWARKEDSEILNPLSSSCR